MKEEDTKGKDEATEKEAAAPTTEDATEPQPGVVFPIPPVEKPTTEDEVARLVALDDEVRATDTTVDWSKYPRKYI